MAKAYSLDLRRRIIESYEQQEGSIRTLAKRYKVSKDCIHQLLTRYHQEGTLLPKPQGGSQARIQAPGKKYLCCLLKVESDLSLEALRDRYYQAFGEYLGITTIHDSLARWKISRKKKQFYDPRQKTPRVEALTQTYHQALEDTEVNNLVFLDEMGAVLNMTSDYGRAPTCERVYGEKSISRRSRVSTIGALSINGIECAMSFEGTLNTAVFLSFIESFLKTTLKPGQVLVMDNAPVHKALAVIEALNDINIKVIYLPPYSPHLNPIEYAWSVAKTFLRKVCLQTTRDLYYFIGKAINKISSAHAIAFFHHVGLCH